MVANDDLMKNVRNMRVIVETQMLPLLDNEPSKDKIRSFHEMMGTCVSTAERAAELYERNALVAIDTTNADTLRDEALEHLEFFEELENSLQISSSIGKFVR